MILGWRFENKTQRINNFLDTKEWQGRRGWRHEDEDSRMKNFLDAKQGQG